MAAWSPSRAAGGCDYREAMCFLAPRANCSRVCVRKVGENSWTQGQIIFFAPIPNSALVRHIQETEVNMLEELQDVLAVWTIIEMGFIPNQDDLVEFDAEDYIKANHKQSMGIDTNLRWYKIMPPAYYFEEGIFEPTDLPKMVKGKELGVLSENDFERLWDAVNFIHRTCAQSKQKNMTDREKLEYVKKVVLSMFKITVIKELPRK